MDVLRRAIRNIVTYGAEQAKFPNKRLFSYI